MDILLLSVIVLGGLGFIFAALLALAADYFRAAEDPRIVKILAILPGTNCGACGVAGCRAFAEKLAAAAGDVLVSGCVSGGVTVVQKLAELMGVAQPTDAHKKIAAVHCWAKVDQRQALARYSGVMTCQSANLVAGGGLMCRYGCLGYADCVLVCPFDAIKMEQGLPVVDPDRCTGCALCVAACPRQIIDIIPFTKRVIVACSSRDSGAVTRKNCPVGCIACKICEKEVPEIFKVIDNLARINYNKPGESGTECEVAINKCPTKCIVKL